MVEHLLPTTSAFLEADVAARIAHIRAPRWINTGAYLLMGWLALLAVKEIVTTMPAGAVVWLVLGGVFFTVGAGVYIAKKPNCYPGVFGFHEIWHIFVMLAAAAHFVAVLGVAL